MMRPRNPGVVGLYALSPEFAMLLADRISKACHELFKLTRPEDAFRRGEE